ncbi:MAG: hypothetical protein OHK0031_03670 [Anaerolineales bacterium]
MNCPEDFHFTPKALFYSTVFGEGIAIYELLYFMGIGGALQALLTPDVGIYGFPHYRYF